MGIKFTTKGSFKNTERFFNKAKRFKMEKLLHRFGKAGVRVLADATPKRSSLTASSWTYEIERTGGNYTLSWLNTNMNNGVSIAILIQYGHGTGTGGYVPGIDYINPAMKGIFDELSETIRKEVANL